LLRRLPLFADVDVGAHHSGHQRHRLGLLAPVGELRVRHAIALPAGIHDAERDDAIGVVEREAAKQDGVDEGEHRGVGPDAQGERGGRGQGEPPILDQQSSCEPDVLPQHHMEIRN
jgi:hypothetical protein